MSKTAQRNRQLYAYGYRVGLGKERFDWTRRARKVGWEAFDRGKAAGKLEKLRLQQLNSNPWLDFKKWVKRTFRKWMKR